MLCFCYYFHKVIDRRASLRHDYDVTCRIVAAAAAAAAKTEALETDSYSPTNAAESGRIVTDFAKQVFIHIKTQPNIRYFMIGYFF